LNWFNPPMGFYYKGRLTRFLYKRLFDRAAQLKIFEDVYLAWNSSDPSVTLLHAVWSDNLQSFSSDLTAVRSLVKAEERVIDSIAHPVITVSDRYRDYLLTSHRGSRRLPQVAVIPLGLDLAAFDIDVPAQHTAKSLVFCGSLEPRKNLRFLLEVFQQLHREDGGYRLTIIGDGPDQTELDRFAAKHALPVDFRGRLDREGVIRELRRHSVYVHPSVKESFSFALLEGKMAGLKTVAYKELEVPVEFVDVPVATFDVADWLASIRLADDVVSKKIETEIYSSRKMMLDTLALALNQTEGTS